MNGDSHSEVIIVGAGPVGLLLALGLGRAGIRTVVLEAHHELLATTRAVVYMPVVLPVLRELGILDTVLAEAYLNKEGVRWRNIEGNVLAHLPLGDETDKKFNGVLLIGQWKMSEIILRKLTKYESVKVNFGSRVVGIEDSADAQTIRVMTHSGSLVDDDHLYRARFVVGTDGANSAVRRMMCIPFEGFTFQDFKMIGADVLYDLTGEEHYGPLNFVVHEKDWAVIAYTGQSEGGLPHGAGRPQWRVAYAEDPTLPSSKEEYVARAKKQMLKYIKKPGAEFHVIRAEPYLMQQRVAAQAWKGRVFLGGDALHSNNPIGGLGLTGGILDAFCYGNAMRRVLREGSDESLLHDCAAARRTAWMEVTNKLSYDNIRRLYSSETEVASARSGFFAKLDDVQTSKAMAEVVRTGFDKMMSDDFSSDSSIVTNES